MTSARLKGRVLTIAGSDSCGGAGLQADIKAISAMGAYAASAVTAVTVQNTTGVADIHPVPTQVIRAQIEAVLTDIGADALKTGMLHSAAVIETVTETCARLAPGVPLVADPVMVATSGDRLLERDAVDAVRTRLLPMAALATPNIPEAEILAGLAITSQSDMERAGEIMMKAGCGAVLLKGGHMKDTDGIHDLLVMKGARHWYVHPRISSRNTHGTGCTLASAIAALLAQGKDLPDAVAVARAYVLEAIRTAPDLGGGAGPLNHMHGLHR